MSRRKQTSDESLRCSFCHKSQGAVGKLISCPSGYPRAYICDECIFVCNSIIEDDRQEGKPGTPALEVASRFINHHLVEEFLVAAENWATRDLNGLPASNELNNMRTLAAKMLAEA